MTEITDTKAVYNDFKYFKSIYTSLNKADTVRIFSDGTSVKFQLLDYKDSEFSKLFGEFPVLSTNFMQWCLSSKKSLKFPVAYFVKIAKTLKANVVSLSFDDNSFTFNFLEDSNPSSITFSALSYDDPSQKFFDMFTHTYSLPNDFTSDDLCRIYLLNDNITKKTSDNKLLEIPTKKILSLVKDGINSVYASDEKDGGSRYVGIASENKNLKMTQVFLTV